MNRGTEVAVRGCMRLVFDRGTIVLEGAGARGEFAQLPGVLWDERMGVLRAPARWRDAIVRELVRQDVRFSDDTRPSLGLPRTWKHVELRPYQAAALTAWEQAGRRGVVVLPTGSGKTRLALAAIALANTRTLVLVPTCVLLEQWRKEIALFYEGPVGCLGDGERVLQPVTVATFESGWRWMATIGSRFDCVIVDEAHHFGAGMRDEALDMTTASMRLGLTATPPTEGPAATNLATLVGSVVFELGIQDLAGTFLANFDVVTLWLDLTPQERREYDGAMKPFRDASRAHSRIAPGSTWAEFLRAAGATDAGRRAIAGYHAARRLLAFASAKRQRLAEILRRHEGDRTLVFTADNEAAYEIARNHLVMPITCDIGRKERADALGDFRDGRVRALVSSRVLNEGLDVPDADVAVVVGATLGEREHVQRIGRVLRPRPGKRAVIYELVLRGTMEANAAKRRRERLLGRATARELTASTTEARREERV